MCYTKKKIQAVVPVSGKEGCLMTEKVCNVLAALAERVAPVAAGSCRIYFYEEKEPDGLQEFVAKKSENAQ